MTDTTECICPKCKTVYPETTNEFCVCGGLLQKKFTMSDVETIFPWLRKDWK
jgi:rRNA maturation endonuclease Nob1